MATKASPARRAQDRGRVLNADQAADYLGISRRKLVRELTKRPVSKGGVGFILPKGSNRYLFPISDLDAWLDRHYDPNGGGR